MISSFLSPVVALRSDPKTGYHQGRFHEVASGGSAVTMVGAEAVVEVDLSVDTNGKMKIVTTEVVMVKVAKEEMAKTEAGMITVVDMAGQTMMMRKMTERIPIEATTETEQDRPNNPDDLIVDQANDIETTEASQNTIVNRNTLDQAHLSRGSLQKHHCEQKDSEIQESTMTTKRTAHFDDDSRIMSSPDLRICSEKIPTMTWNMI